MNLLNFIGVGTVLENKPENTHFIKVMLKSEFPQADGAGLANAVRQTTSNPTANGGYQSSDVLESNFYQPKWIGMEPNRVTSPDVRVGSQVAIYKFADDDLLYWTTWGIGNESMRLEHVVYAWNADPNFKRNAPFSFDNYYTLVMSTRHQEVVFKTTQANGEPVAFRLGFNTKNGTWALTDTEQNAFALDSMKHIWVMRNREGSIFNINRKNISIICKGSQLFEAEKSIHMKTKDMFIDTKTLTITSEDSLKMTTKELTVNADKTKWTGSKIDITSPENSILGNLSIAGNLGVAGGMSVTGGAGGGGGTLETSGGINAEKTIESKVDVIAAGISLKNHSHTDSRGGGTSPPKA